MVHIEVCLATFELVEGAIITQLLQLAVQILVKVWLNIVEFEFLQLLRWRSISRGYFVFFSRKFMDP